MIRYGLETFRLRENTSPVHMAAYEQPFDNPPTYVESTSRPGRPARPSSGAQPANIASSGSPPFVTSGGWIPPAGTWQSANPNIHAGHGAPAVPPLPPRQPTVASTSRNGHDRDDSSDDDASSSNQASSSRYPEEKRSSGLFGGFGKRKEKAPLPESSSSSDEAPSSSFWRGNGRNASAAQAQPAPSGKRDKGKSRQAKEPELAPSSRYTDSSEEALRNYLARIPADAQKALAPLGIVGDAKSVEGIYSVELSTHTKWIPAANGQGTTVNPTCSFTANARNDVDVTLYLRPNQQQRQQDQLLQQQNAQQGKPALPARTHGGIPLEILLRAAKGRIRFSLPEKLPDRPLRIICTLECKPARARV